MFNLWYLLIPILAFVQPSPPSPVLILPDHYDAISPDGEVIVSYAVDESQGLWLWDANTREPIRLLYKDASRYQSNYQIRFSPDGNRIVAAAESRILIWDVYGGEAHIIPTGVRFTGGFIFSPDSQFLGGRTFNQVWIWRWDTYEQLPGSPFSIENIQHYALTTTDLFVVAEDSIHRRSLEDNTALDQSSVYMQRINHLVIASDGNTAYYVGCRQTNGNGSICTNNTVVRWDSTTGELHSMPTLMADAYTIQFGPNEKFIVLSGCGDYSYVSTVAVCGETGYIRMDVRTLKPFQQSYSIYRENP